MLTFPITLYQLQCYFTGGIARLGEQQSEVCKGLVYILKAVHCESIYVIVLCTDIDMYLSLPFLTQLYDGNFTEAHSSDESPLQSKTNDTGMKLL